ncbi:unnamed protein product, partial [Adineta steineri]
ISISEQTEETIEDLLSSLINLLQAEIATKHITMIVFIEILNVLHRLYFARSDLKTHVRILKIVDKIFHIVPSCSQITTTSNEDHLIPGESFLFASLELLVCVLISYYPHIAGDLQLGPIFQMKLSIKSNTDNNQINELILLNVKLLSQLITLCTTDEGLQALIPVILHLLLSSSFALLSTKTDEQKQLLSTINQLLDNIFSTTIDKNILYSTMITIINFRTNLINKGISDNGHFVQCLTSLIINSTSINLTDQCIDFYQKAFEDEQTETHIRVLQCLNQLFQCANISIRNRLIQIFTPLLLNEIKKLNENQQQQEYIIEILIIFETLLAAVDSTLQSINQRIGKANKNDVEPLRIPLLIVGSKYDEFQKLEPEAKKTIIKTLRFLAFYHGATLLSYSEKQESVYLKSAIHHLLFDTNLPEKQPQIDYQKPLYIKSGSDTLEQVGPPPIPEYELGDLREQTPLAVWRAAYCKRFPQEVEKRDPSLMQDYGRDPQYADASIDAMREQKIAELQRYLTMKTRSRS